MAGADVLRNLTMLISIGMPVYNCEETIVPALRSLIYQSYANWELWLIDDGSTDRTLAAAAGIRDPRIHIIADGQRKNLSARLNQAVILSRGKYFARMDGDDIAYPERLAAQIHYLENHSDIDLVGGRVLIFKNNGTVVGTYPFRESHHEICLTPYSGFYLPHPTWMGKIEWFQKHLYRAAFTKSQDYELLLRTYRHSRFAAIPEILCGYRVNSLSLKSILLSRYFFSRALIRFDKYQKNIFRYGGVFEQMLKGMADIFAVGTGLNYRVLRHRAMPVTPSEIDRWRKVWDVCKG